jgi:glycosyltransferase involved in cell wall biosynthesis
MMISIAMATYNGERFLQEQLDSLARQTLLPHELVVCDDGSTDATVSILEAFATKSPFDVRIYQNEKNLGFGDAFLRAATLCEGDWIAFCDQDDVWFDHKLTRYAEVVVAHPEVDLMSHSADQVDAGLNPLPHRIPDHKEFSVTGPLANRMFGVISEFTCCVRRALLTLVPIEDRPSDMDCPSIRQSHGRLIYHVVDTYGYTARLPESLALYRRHESSVTESRGIGVHRPSIRSRLKAWSYAEEEGFLHMADQARQHQSFYQHILVRAEGGNDKDMFVQRTNDAIAYYGRIATAFEVRAKLYTRGTKASDKYRAFIKCFRQGGYSDLAGRGGLGKKALAKDLVRVVARW